MATINVSNSSQLYNALASANGGDRIVLASGNYGELQLQGTQNSNYLFNREVTIESADPNRPAVLKELYLRNVSNITLDNIVFDLDTTSSTSSGVQPFKIDASTNVRIQNSTFDGDVFKGGGVGNGYGTGFGLKVLRSENISINDNFFSNFRIASGFTEIKNLQLVGNTYDDNSGDSMKLGQITGGLIEGNTVLGIRANPDDPFHRDMIQILTMNDSAPSTDIIIRGNILHSGDHGNYSQSIFMGNEAVSKQNAGREMFYRDILIEDNVIFNAQANAIRVHSGIGIDIRNNTLLHNIDGGDRGGVSDPKIHVYGSESVSILKNIAHNIVTSGNSQQTISGNLIVQRDDRSDSNHYDNLFVDAEKPAASVDDLQALPNSIIEQQGIGAAITRGADYSTDTGAGAPTPPPSAPPSEPDEPEPTPPATVDEIKLNAGAGGANGFDSDAAYVSGGSTYKNSKSIAATTQDGIYQSERFGDFSYDIPVENGEYTVVLKFAEIYFNNVGAREFDVRAEGKTVINDLDIVKAAGGANRAYDVTLDVDVNDRRLDLDFISGNVNLAKLSGLEVRAGTSGGSTGGSGDSSSGGSTGGSGSTGSNKYDLVVANRYDRSDAKDLEGARIDDGDRGFVFVNGAGSGVSKVDFYFDNPSASGSPSRTDTDAPFDFIGTGGGANKAPKPWSTSNIADGEHTITARITETDGDQVVITDTFELI